MADDGAVPIDGSAWEEFHSTWGTNPDEFYVVAVDRRTSQLGLSHHFDTKVEVWVSPDTVEIAVGDQVRPLGIGDAVRLRGEP